MSKIGVLVIEHYPIFREGLCRLLSDQEDIEVIASTDNGEEAVNISKQLTPHVAIVDADMPHFNSVKVAKGIKEGSPKTAILMLSSQGWESSVLASVRAGVAGYLLKEVSSAELINAIRSIHAGEIVFDMKAARPILRRIGSEKKEGVKGYEELNHREVEVIRLVAQGIHNREISKTLYISERTVQTHLINIYRKLGVNTRTEAAIHALKEGFLE